MKDIQVNFNNVPRKTLDVKQKSPEWLAIRENHFTASDAPAMMGVSPYQSRAAFLRRKALGSKKKSSSNNPLFAAGHRAEEQYRPIAEELIGAALLPDTVSCIIDGMPMLASLDGITLDGSLLWEHKLWNDSTALHIVETGEPPIRHVWQLEHQLLVTGAERVLFVTSNGTPNKCAMCWYDSKPSRRAELIDGWRKFAFDLAAYVPPARKTNHKESIVTVTPVKLPSDVARCVGVGDQLCNTCARLSISGSERVWVWPEPLIKDGKCELFIDGYERQTRSSNVEAW